MNGVSKGGITKAKKKGGGCFGCFQRDAVAFDNGANVDSVLPTFDDEKTFTPEVKPAPPPTTYNPNAIDDSFQLDDDEME